MTAVSVFTFRKKWNKKGRRKAFNECVTNGRVHAFLNMKNHEIRNKHIYAACLCINIIIFTMNYALRTRNIHTYTMDVRHHHNQLKYIPSFISFHDSPLLYLPLTRSGSTRIDAHSSSDAVISHRVIIVMIVVTKYFTEKSVHWPQLIFDVVGCYIQSFINGRNR